MVQLEKKLYECIVRFRVRARSPEEARALVATVVHNPFSRTRGFWGYEIIGCREIDSVESGVSVGA